MLIDAEGLDMPILIPPRPRDQIHEFDVYSSKNNNHHLFTKTADANALAYGLGGKFHARRHFGTNNKHCIGVEDQSNYCLFVALELSRLYHDHKLKGERESNGNKSLLSWDAFYNIAHGKSSYASGKRQRIAKELIAKANIHLIRALTASNMLLKSRSSTIMSIQHRLRCVARCPSCTEIGWSYPCTPTAGFHQECAECNRSFLNSNCFVNHLKNGCCRTYKKCTSCRQPYNTKKKHVCGELFCRLCHVYHEKKRGCFIQPLEYKPNLSLTELCAWTLNVRDSFLLMPVKLAALPKTFGLAVKPKMYFPHLFNKVII
uniref:Uncharacterized protein n=1 Tax=Ditylenchus dipsaci TaxID=166011 RepID=A0A915DJ14_9BILA